MFGVNDLDDPDITPAEWGRKGRRIFVHCEQVGADEGGGEYDLFGPSYISTTNNRVPRIWEEKFEDFVTYETRYLDAAGTSTLTKGKKYRFELPDDAKSDARIFFLMGARSVRPITSGVTEDNFLTCGLYKDSGFEFDSRWSTR